MGRAVMLNKELSKSVIKEQSLDLLSLSSIFLSGSKKKKDGIYFPFFHLSFKTKGLIGRNWGAYKKHLIDVNGFDNDYVFAGVGEDADVEWRLSANGLRRKSVKNKAFVFHLFHGKVYSEHNVTENFRLFDEKKESNNIKCLNGLEQLSIIKNMGNPADSTKNVNGNNKRIN